MTYDIFLGISVGLSFMLFWLGRRFSRPPIKVEDQFDRYLDDASWTIDPVSQKNLSELSFAERVIVPMWDRMLVRLGGIAPQRNLEELAKRIETAGRPHSLNVLNFLGLKLILALVFAPLGFVIITLLLGRPVLAGVVFTLAFALLGFYFPNLWLASVIRGRQHDIVRALPDALDMIVICVEAGQSFDQALRRVSAHWQNSLTEEFNRIVAEIALGRTRREALTSASERIASPEMSNFIMSIVQADQLGVSIGKVLRTQADQLRTIRRQRAEGLAREATIKLLFPLVFLIFPAMFAVLLGPAVPLILETLGALS